jgi:hypothetical protein
MRHGFAGHSAGAIASLLLLWPVGLLTEIPIKPPKMIEAGVPGRSGINHDRPRDQNPTLNALSSAVKGRLPECAGFLQSHNFEKVVADFYNLTFLKSLTGI